ncbi:restriction endonuclease [Pseudactinotalea sp. HY158]|uniref:restriction endonuclease n=1 Tax=Pseudactinotalea sp. HY158 TaxID=2654547 RepID=UPI00129C77FF|nr:restriction endonuclease [Pseudactinotalea sp. HY158]QGH69321.1 restriction endonuclease [Pseudactinotalea sp. HY158]
MRAPTWDQYMAPSLRVLAGGEVHRGRDIVAAAADLLDLSGEHRAVVIPSGQEQYRNRGNWALSYLARAGAVERPARGHYRITEVGRRLLADHPGGITERHLRALSGDPNAPHTIKAFPAATSDALPSSAPGPGASGAPRPRAVAAVEESALDPEEQISFGVARIDEDVADQLLTRIWAQEPVFFEQAVLDLLMAMGYGGAEGEATRTQLSNDVGIDGIIDQDALGLSRIYVQAKRYGAENTVGREAIQAFVGALAGNQANQGVFITTSRFSRTAIDYAGSIATRVILIDGDRLARLMIRYGVGVQVKRRIEIVEIDEDFFE